MKIITIIAYIVFLISLPCGAVETHRIEHEEGHLAERGLYNDNQPVQYSINEIENYIELPEEYEIPEKYKDQAKSLEQLKENKRKTRELEDDYRKGNIDEEQYGKKLEELREEMKKYNYSLIRNLKMPTRMISSTERHLANVGGNCYGFPCNLIEEVFGEPDFIEYDEKNKVMVWRYFGWAEKFMRLAKDKVGETTTSQGGAKTRYRGRADIYDRSIDYRGTDTTDFAERSTTMDIYEVLGVFKAIKVRRAFIFDSRTGEVVETTDWCEYRW